MMFVHNVMDLVVLEQSIVLLLLFWEPLLEAHQISTLPVWGSFKKNAKRQADVEFLQHLQVYAKVSNVIKK